MDYKTTLYFGPMAENGDYEVVRKGKDCLECGRKVVNNVAHEKCEAIEIGQQEDYEQLQAE